MQAQVTENSRPDLITIRGLIRDAKTKEPIPTAQVRSNGYNAAASANSDGSFQIQVLNLNDILSISAIDYNNRDFSLKGKDSVVIDLYPVFFTNPYKVVETLSGQLNNTFTTQGINSFTNTSTSPNISIDNEIQTQLGGNIRSINRSGTPGIGASLFMQGINSIRSNAQPLYVVDGIIWENYYDEISLHTGYYTNPLLTIDVSDIESVTLLKDGTSIYGSKAANGVVLIKTNRGKDMITKITAKSFWGITQEPKLIPVMNANDYRIYASDIFNGTSSFKDQFLNNDPSVPSYPKYHNSTNWNDEVYRTGFTHSYSINVKGGDERALYMFSLGYTGNDGIVKMTDMERFNARFNSDIKFTNKFNLSFNISYTNIDRNLRNDGVDSLSPTFLGYVKAPFFNPYQYTRTGEKTVIFEDADDFGIGNPTAIIQNSVNINKQNRFTIGIMPNLIINSHLYIQNQFGYSLNNIREGFFRHDIGSDSVRIPKYNIVAYNQASNQYSKNISLYNDARLVYHNNLGFSHDVRGIIGWRYISNDYSQSFGRGYNTPNNSPGIDDAEKKEAFGMQNKYRSISTYAVIDYSFMNRYFLSTSFDMDASSRFGNELEGGFDFLGKKWGIFPSVNAAWIASSESFMRSLDFISLLKIKAGYGITGNDDFGYFNNYASLVSKEYTGVLYGLVVGNLANNTIKWETTRRANLGFDIALLNERIFLSGNYFRSTTDDLLTLTEYPEITGLDKYWDNGGKLSNTGFDITASCKLLNMNKLKWEIGLSVGHYKNSVKSLKVNEFSTKIYGGEVLTKVNNPAAVFYGYKTDGVFINHGDAGIANLKIIDDLGNSHSFAAGDIRFVDVDTNHIINNADKQIIGDPNPDFYGAFNSRLMFGNITVDMLFTYSYGNDVYNYLRSQLESGSTMYNQTIAKLNRWRTLGQVTDQPRVVYGDPIHNAAFSDRWIEDGSFLKFKSLVISYKVPLKTKAISGLNVWFSVNNIFTLTNYLGSDPEFSVNNSVYSQGIDVGFIPATRSYFAGLNINL